MGINTKNLFPRIKARLPRRRKMEVRTVAVCAAQVPFFQGGAEAHVQGLVRSLGTRGYEVDLINLPYKWYPHEQLLKSIRIWQMIDLTESNGKRIDMVIATKFPSYFIDHPNKVLWLIHQYRQAYDLLHTPYSGFAPESKKDMKLRQELVDMDTAALMSYRRIYTNAGNTAMRLKKYNGVNGEPLYHPPRLAGRYRTGVYGNYILSVGRLDPLKRVDLLIKSLRHCRRELVCRIAGMGPERERLEALAREAGITERVEFLGYVSDEELLSLYAGCSAVFFAPLDEDYGYVTLEAFLSKKPVVTTYDSGGPLEFVKHEENGIVLDSLDEKDIAKGIEKMFFDKAKCRKYGESGYEAVKDISWDHVIDTLIPGRNP